MSTATVIYFHGMLPGSTDWAPVRELSELGTEPHKRGVTLIAPRGEQRLCPWAKTTGAGRTIARSAHTPSAS